MTYEIPRSADADLAGWASSKDRLHLALEKDEFALYCQPILAFEGPERYPMGEVLVRLHEEEKALLPPGDFLPVFEHYATMGEATELRLRVTDAPLAG